jgi:small subunit ribosomal protein S17
MRKTFNGQVVSDKMQETAVVEVTIQKVHPLLKKRYRRTRRVLAHNPENTYKTGDQVVIGETKPQSRLKRFEIIASNAAGVKKDTK